MIYRVLGMVLLVLVALLFHWTTWLGVASAAVFGVAAILVLETICHWIGY